VSVDGCQLMPGKAHHPCCASSSAQRGCVTVGMLRATASLFPRVVGCDALGFHFLSQEQQGLLITVAGGGLDQQEWFVGLLCVTAMVFAARLLGKVTISACHTSTGCC
jgi:hypothetical protein